MLLQREAMGRTGKAYLLKSMRSSEAACICCPRPNRGAHTLIIDRSTMPSHLITLYDIQCKLDSTAWSPHTWRTR